MPLSLASGARSRSTPHGVRGHRVVVGSLLSTLIILNIAFHKKGFTSEVSVASYFGDGNSRRSFSSFPLCVCDNVKQDIEKYKAFYRRAVPFLDLFYDKDNRNRDAPACSLQYSTRSLQYSTQYSLARCVAIFGSRLKDV